jgi:hypothetical protein
VPYILPRLPQRKRAPVRQQAALQQMLQLEHVLRQRQLLPGDRHDGPPVPLAHRLVCQRLHVHERHKNGGRANGLMLVLLQSS